jgi:hypothetical protein
MARTWARRLSGSTRRSPASRRRRLVNGRTCWVGRRGPRRFVAAAFEEALALHRAADSRAGIAFELLGLGMAALLQGDHVEARRTLLAGMRLAREEHVARGSFPMVLVTLARIEAREGRVLRAARLLGAVDRALEETRRLLPSQHQQRFEDLRATLTAEIGEDDLARLWDEGRAMGLDEAVDYALEERVTPASDPAHRARPTH